MIRETQDQCFECIGLCKNKMNNPKKTCNSTIFETGTNQPSNKYSTLHFILSLK